MKGDIRLEAPPRNKAELAAIAWQIREKFGLTAPYLPVAALIECLLPQALGDRFVFTVHDRQDMGNRHGFVDPSTGELALREDVYLGLCSGKGRDRFTACHELGHWFLHRGAALNRVRAVSNVPAYRDPEWQANEFSGAILMPQRLLTRFASVDEIVEEFGVSEEAASYRVRKLGMQSQIRGS